MKPIPTLSPILIIILVLLVFFLVMILLAGLGVGLGFLLTVCIPSLPLGHAVVSGTIIAVAVVFLFRTTIGKTSNEDPPESEFLDDEEVEILAKEIFRQRSGGTGRRGHRK